MREHAPVRRLFCAPAENPPPWQRPPSPLAPGKFYAPRDSRVVFEELENVLTALLATFRPGPQPLAHDLPAKPARSGLLRTAGLLAAELAALRALRATADVLDFLVKTYRTPPGERARTAYPLPKRDCLGEI